MNLSRIILKNYRNFENLELSFSPGLNCILGQNGSGKTNILESIFYLNYKKSFRRSNSFSQIVCQNADEPFLQIQSLWETAENNTSDVISLVEDHQKHHYETNGKISKRRLKQEFAAHVVFFAPQASYLFHYSPTERRKNLDQFIASLDPNYESQLQIFNKTLRQRNALATKTPKLWNSAVNTSYESKISLTGHYIHNQRKYFVNKINEYIEETIKALGSWQEPFSLEFTPKKNWNSAKELENWLQSRREKDLLAGRTTSGPHLDDYRILMNNAPITEIGSQGQQKIAYLGLELAKILCLRAFFKELDSRNTPSVLVLLDDVSGELDSLRLKNLLEYLIDLELQVLLTSASESVVNELIEEDPSLGKSLRIISTHKLH